MLCDTNILIELLKGNEETIRLLQEWEGELCISAITAMEL
ncbi:MAG: type II toxin-antitoxin system VapC family toxin, partial [Epsilonproteobacteria bacterium]|nr:type II toxin-antitoxin system VapC family toxin [Campylobacterota bacterium]